MAGESRAVGTAIMGGTRLLGAILQLISFRVMIEALGGSLVGIYFVLGTALLWVSLFDLAIFDGGGRLIAIAEGNNDRKRIHHIWHTLVIVALWHCVLAVFFAVILSFTFSLDTITSGESALALWLSACLTYCAGFFYTGFTSYFNALKEFKMIGKVGLIMVVSSSLFSLCLVIYFKTLSAYLIGFSLGYVISIIYAFIQVKKDKKKHDSKAIFDKEVFAECFKFAKKGMIGKVSTSISRSISQLTIGKLGTSDQNYIFGTGSRLPETLNDALPIQRVFIADLARSHEESPESFAKEFSHATVMSLFAAFAIIWLPSSAADGLLRLYLGPENYRPEMYIILLAIALYMAFENLFSSIGFATAAIGQPQLVAPFVIFNGIFLTIFAFPFYTWFGVVGLAYLKVLGHLLQLVPMAWYVKKYIAPKIKLIAWVNKLAAITSIAVLLGGVNFLFIRLELIKNQPILTLLPLICMPIVYIVVCDRVKLIRIPDAIRKKLPLINKLCP